MRITWKFWQFVDIKSGRFSYASDMCHIYLRYVTHESVATMVAI